MTVKEKIDYINKNYDSYEMLETIGLFEQIRKHERSFNFAIMYLYYMGVHDGMKYLTTTTQEGV